MAPALVSVLGSSISENGTAIVTATISDPGSQDIFSVQVNWGEGSPDTITGLGLSDTSGSVGATSYSWIASSRALTLSHQYLDDNPTGTLSDNYTVSLTATDDDLGTVSTTTTVTVSNVAPALVSVLGSSISENGTAIVTATISDPGSQDVFSVQVNWGEGSPDTITGLGLSDTSGSVGATSYSWIASSRALTLSHQYLDDNPTGTLSDNYTVSLTATDDDLGTVSTTTTVTVSNVAPALVSVLGSSISENGTATVTATISDPGSQDVFSVQVNWGEGSPDTITGLGLTNASGSIGATSYSWIAASRALTLSHQYLDDNPTGTLSDNYTVSLTATDDDLGTVSTTTTVTVSNVAPALVSVLGSSISENGTASVTATISDPGSKDIFSVQVNWGEGSPDTITGLGLTNASGSIGATSYSWIASSRALTLSHQYLDDNPTGTSSDNYTVSLTATDDDLSVSPVVTTTVTVNNVAPIVSILGIPVAPNEGTPITLTAGISDPGTLDTFTYSWIVTKNGNPYALGSSSSITFTPNDNASYGVSLSVNDDDGGIGATSATIIVNNVAPTIALTGASSINEGTSYSLTLGTITDPGSDTVTTWIVNWGDGGVNVYSAGGVKTHLYDDNAAVSGPIVVDLIDEDGYHAAAGSLVRTVNNVAPSGFAINSGPVNEGSSATVLVVGQTDPSTADTTAGFTYGYDFNNDGDFVDAGEIASTTLSSVSVPSSYLDNNPSRIVHVQIRDKDGGATNLFTTIVVNNVAPVVTAGPNAVALASSPFSRTITFTDPGNEPFWTASIDWNGDSITDQTFTTTSHSFNISHTYNPIEIGNVYNVSVSVNDGTVTSVGTFQLTVVADTFRVTNFQTYASGFDVTFNRAPDLADLNLYSGIPVGFQASDVLVVGSTVGQVKGSIVWSAATNTLSFVKTGGVLAADTYSVTLLSGSTAFNDLSASLLDGNSDFVAGGDYVTSFAVAASTARVVSIRDFARGPGQSVDDTPATAGSKLAVRIDNASNVTALDFDVHYDPTLLTISGATLATGLPSGWSITPNFVSPGVLKITASGTTPLSGSNVSVVLLNTSVPSTAPYGDSEVIRLVNVRVNEDLITSKADYAVHKNTYLGDADGDGFYLGFDAALISRVVVALDSGFSAERWTDPLIVADTTGDGTLSGLDASYVAQKAVFLARPEIPNIPVVSLVPGTAGVDPQLSVPDSVSVVPGGSVTLPVSIDINPAAQVYSATFRVTYNTSVLDFNTASLGAFWPAVDGWNILYNEISPGDVYVTIYNSSASTIGTGAIANIAFDVLSSAPGGESPVGLIKVGPNEGSLSWTLDAGSVNVVVGPSSSIIVPSIIRRGEPTNVTFNVTTPSLPTDTFSYAIDWDGNGTFDETITGGPSLTTSHIFNAAGSLDIRVKVTDQLSVVGPITHASATVIRYEVIGTDLWWYGSTGADTVDFTEASPSSISFVETLENGVVLSQSFTATGVTGVLRALGRAGNDDIDASAFTTKASVLEGSDGNDILRTGAASDTINGGLGVDTIYGGDGSDTIYGDLSTGKGDSDLIFGEGGNDNIWADGSEGGLNAKDTVDGGAGNDTISSDGAEGASDSVTGGSGDDVIKVGPGNDWADGGNDNDILNGGDGAEGSNDTLLGGDGRDILLGDTEHITSTAIQPAKIGGADSLVGGAGEDIIISGVYDTANASDILLIQAEWLSGRSYADRVANISGTGVGPRNNGSAFLTPDVTLFNDHQNALPLTQNRVDTVLGGGDMDWLLFDTAEDTADTEPGEEIVDLNGLYY